MTATVAVTGATGFVGGHLIRALSEAGWTIRILARRLPSQPEPTGGPIVTIIGDLEDEACLRRLVGGCDAVVHAAGLIKARSRAEFVRVNAGGVARLAALAAGQESPPHFVLLSSLAAREPRLSDYAASKRSGEEALAKAGGRLGWTILRPTAIYGPGDRETLAFLRAVAHGIAPRLGGPQSRLSLVHVRDVAAAVVAVLGSADRVAGATYEVGDRKPGGYTWDEMAAVAARVLGTQPRAIRIPRAALTGVAAANRLLGLLTGHPRMLTPGKAREILHQDWVCRDTGLAEATGWRARIDLEEGFADAIAWYRATGWL